MTRSFRFKGRCELSARLFFQRPISCLATFPMSFVAAPLERNFSVTMPTSGWTYHFSAFFKNLGAEVRSRRLVTKHSGTSLSSSNARQRYCWTLLLSQKPRRGAKTSSSTIEVGVPAYFRILDANTGPNLFHQKRMASWLPSMPPSCSKTSDFHSESGKRTYIIILRRMTYKLVLKRRKESVLS